MIITLPKLHKNQILIAQNDARFKVLACGRQFGKTMLSCCLLLKEALEGGKCFYVFPNFPMSAIGFRILKALAKQIPIAHVNESSRMITFDDCNGFIQMKSGDNPDSLRGETLDFIVLDEAAFLDEEAWTILKPSLVVKEGGALLISTPNGKNWFWELYELGLTNNVEYKSFHFTSYDNPYIKATEIDKQKENMPLHRFNTEFLAMFDEDSSVFGCIGDVLDGQLQEPKARCEYVAGIDLARANDFTVVTILDVKSGNTVAFERYNKMTWRLIVEKITHLINKYDAVSICDSTGVGDAILEQLRPVIPRIIGYHFTNDSKVALIEKLIMSIEKKSIHIDKRLTELQKELKSFGVTRTKSGNLNYCAKGSMHDDCCISLALANYGRERYGTTNRLTYY